MSSFLVVLVFGLLLGLPAAGGQGTAGGLQAGERSIDSDVVLAVRYHLAVATKADALAKIERLRTLRADAIASLEGQLEEPSESRAVNVAGQERLERLERKLGAEWTRWRRSNRRAYAARQLADSFVAVPEEDPALGDDGPTAAQWEQLRTCEAGGDYAIVSANGLYFGAYQFNLATWESVGGTGSPAKATPAEQDERAKVLFGLRGAGPWPHCGKYLET